MNSDWRSHRRYGVFVDAGSSGSRVQIYSYKDVEYLQKKLRRNILAQSLVHIELGDELGLHWQFKEEPGMATYAAVPHKLYQHLKPLIDYAKQAVPPDQHAFTPFYLYATAGMRLLDPLDRDRLLDKTCQYVKQNSAFVLDDCAQQVRVITGEQEGMYGWVTVNYLMHGFRALPYTLVEQQLDRADHPSFGFMDMGGASAQIAYEPSLQVIKEHAHWTGL
jgi:Golgi nucleoside diphosphatase